MKIFLFFLSHRFSIRAIYWNTIWQGSEIKKHFSIRLCLDSRQIILMQKLQYFIIIRALSRHIATCFNSRFTLDFYWIIQKWCWLSLLLWKWRLVRAVCDTLLERRLNGRRRRNKHIVSNLCVYCPVRCFYESKHILENIFFLFFEFACSFTIYIIMK